MPPLTISYGDHASQFMRVSVPASPPPSGAPVAVLVHGGYWKQKWTVDNTPMPSVVPSLLEAGMAVAEVEYRRRDDEGGGYPGTNTDVKDAVHALVRLRDDGLPLDLSDVILLGHSAGGTLVLWLAAQPLAVRVRLVVAVAPVADLVQGYERKLSDEGDAIQLYMKCTPDDPGGADKYRTASPAAHVPLPVPLLLVTGDKDEDVPPDMVRAYHASCAAARKTTGLPDGVPELTLLEISGADHYSVLTAGDPAWTDVLQAMLDVRGALARQDT